MIVYINGQRIEAPDGASIVAGSGSVVVGGSVRGSVIVTGAQRVEYKESVVVTVEGHCGSIETVSGAVTVSGGVSGDVKSTSGDVKCGAVGGSVKTVSGDVNCGSVSGSVQSVSGDCRRR